MRQGTGMKTYEGGPLSRSVHFLLFFSPLTLNLLIPRQRYLHLSMALDHFKKCLAHPRKWLRLKKSTTAVIWGCKQWIQIAAETESCPERTVWFVTQKKKKKKSLDVVLKKHRIMGLSVIPYIFSVLPRNTTPNVKTICTLSVTAGVCINRCLKAYIYEFSTVQSSHKLSRTRGRSRPSWWHWLIPLLRVPFSCLVLIECNSLLAPLHQIRQWSLRWPAGAQRWG